MALVALTLGAFVAVAGQSSADVATVSGSAYGASGSVNFGPNNAVLAPTPSVTLPPSGSALPITATAPSSVLAPNGFVIYQSGALTVSTQGTIGAGGSSTSSASVASPVLAGFTATTVSSVCGASETALTGSTTVTNGRIVFNDDDPAVSGEPGEDIVIVPANPTPNLTFEGPVENTPDRYRLVFNEQVVTAGSITVNAVHITLLGPNATGEVIIGQVHCDFTATPATTTTTQAPVTTSTTQAPVTTSTTQAPVTTSTTQAPVTTSTTQAPVTTSTTQAPVTTSTTQAPVTTSTTQAPVTTSTTQAPVTTSTTQAPVTTSTTAAPVTTTTTTINVPPATPSVSIGGAVNVTEPAAGSSPATFTVTLDAASTSVVSVNFATTDGTALAGADYVARSGTLVFEPGETTKTVEVSVLADSLAEATESFSLVLSNPVGASLGQLSAAATIADAVATPPAVVPSPGPPTASPAGSDVGAPSGATASPASAGTAVTRSSLARTGALITSQVQTALLLLLAGVVLVLASRQRSIRRSRARRSLP